MVNGVEPAIGKGERKIVHIPELKLTLLVQTSRVRKLVPAGDLIRIDIDPHHAGAGIGSHAAGNATPSAADIEGTAPVSKIQVAAHPLFKQRLIREDALRRVDRRRNVHFLDLAERTEMIEDTVVIHELAL